MNNIKTFMKIDEVQEWVDKLILNAEENKWDSNPMNGNSTIKQEIYIKDVEGEWRTYEVKVLTFGEAEPQLSIQNTTGLNRNYKWTNIEIRTEKELKNIRANQNLYSIEESMNDNVKVIIYSAGIFKTIERYYQKNENEYLFLKEEKFSI